MSLTIDHHAMDGSFEFDTESFGWPVLRAHANSNGNAYLGYAAQDDLLTLGKAIVNAMEPEALVENQTAAEPEPYKPQVGDWVKVADSQMYNRYFRGQTLQVVNPGYRVSDFEVVVRGTDGFSGSIRLKDVTPASDPTPEPEQPSVADLITRIDTLEAQVTALTAQADSTIRVGDTVRVEPNDWNIPTPSSTRGLAVTGTVTSIVSLEQGNRYLVEYRSLVTGNPVSIYAVKATKVVPRG